MRNRKARPLAAQSCKLSKARSCEACRRLKTRCEIRPGFDQCHRCEVLQLDCSSRGVARGQPSLRHPESTAGGKSQCDCHDRLTAVEAALVQIQASMPVQGASRDQEKEKLEVKSPSIAEQTARDAPMSLIQEIRENMALPQQPSTSLDSSEDSIISSIVSEELASMLLDGFSKLSSRWLFMSTEPAKIYSKSSLLLGACILAGLHSVPTLHGSETHHRLYRHVHGLLGRAHLASPASFDTIQAMLIFAMWDLRPTRDYDHGNSWFLSGMAAMQVVMMTRFDQLLCTNISNQTSQSRELMRTWNLICLCQLQFSVGSGRPPVIAKQYFDQCAKILDFPSYNSRDELVLAGVELYRTLWDLTSSNVFQKERATWPEIDRLRKTHDRIYKLDSSEPLRFAYSCTYLILARRTLQHLNYTQNPASKDPSTITQKLPFIKEAIYQSHQLLNLFLSMSDLTTYIHPAYETLLCSFAMVTLAEFVSHIHDVNKTVVLMEGAVLHIQHSGKAEPVSRWSLNIVRQHPIGNGAQESLASTVTDHNLFGNLMNEEALKPWEERDWSFEQEFPSLEEMFFGNVV